MKRIPVFLICLAFIKAGHGQELFVFTEPASNMPSKSASIKSGMDYIRSSHHNDRIDQRYMPELMFGLNRNWMLHVTGTFSDMFTNKIAWESIKVYAKYRFLSLDDVHKHFRMALFAQASHSQNPVYFDELSLDGDQSGVQGGLIVTRLLNKLALSSTVSYLYVSTIKPEFNPGAYPYHAFNYSASAGYLLFPFSYTSYNQVNLNLYMELLGQQTLDDRHYFADLAPALQLIFNSNAKLDIGYRFELDGDMERMARKHWVISFEYVFLDALKRKQ